MSGKTSAKDGLMKTVMPVIASNGVPYIHIRSVESRSASGMEKKGIEKVSL